MLKSKVVDLLHQVRPLGNRPVQNNPASGEQLLAFEQAHGLILPVEIKEWFNCCNGAEVNPGGIYSLSSLGEEASLGWYLENYPEWKENKWFPIASDGCGDLYIMAAKTTIPSTGTHPICFLDQSDFVRPQYAVSSGLWKFLYLLLHTEILNEQGGIAYWPFNKEAVLAVDPALAECRDIALPWEIATD